MMFLTILLVAALASQIDPVNLVINIACGCLISRLWLAVIVAWISHLAIVHGLNSLAPSFGTSHPSPIATIGAFIGTLAIVCLSWWIRRRLIRAPQPKDGDIVKQHNPGA